MASPAISVEQMVNIGPTVARRLHEIGIHTIVDLREVGAVNAYRLICQRAEKAVPVCYYLYSLEGALRNQHWNDVSARVKKRLLSEVRT